MCLCLPRDHGVLGSAEVVLGLVDVSMADPTVQHLHHHIFRACVPVVVTSTTNPYYGRVWLQAVKFLKRHLSIFEVLNID